MAEINRSSDVSRPKNMLFVVAALTLTLTVFSGFTPTYFSSSESFPPLLHLHAALFFGWVLLFLLQVILVAGNHLAAHRQVGVVGAFWALATVLSGFYLAAITIGRDLDLIDGTFGAVPTVIPLSQICMFSCFVTLAIANTKKPDVHKRFMMLAALVAITPALARFGLAAFGGPSPGAVVSIFLVSNGLLVAVGWYDTVHNRRLHTVFLYGGLAILLVRVLRVPFAMSPMWRWTAESMSNFAS